MSILNIINLPLPQINILNYDLTCVGNGEMEQCSVEDNLIITDYISYIGDMFLVFDQISVNQLDIQLSKNGEQYQVVNNINYVFNNTDSIMLKTSKDTTDSGPNPIDISYNMYIYRDPIDQNENDGLPVLLNTVRINFNIL